ncbi:MAG: molybdopterin-dependent oxidoreductase [Hyphomicrobiaceae bacterium]|nr:molybdopterin-dependent oxidoreductase [Hyphomicrobiaceae bacterium]
MLNRRQILMSALALGAAAALPAPARAGLSAPTGKVLLTARGKITQTNADGAALFDMDMLEKLPSRLARVKTPWTEGIVEFQGPLGSALLDTVGATGDTLRFTALNDYSVEIPAAEFRAMPIILATRMNGKPMPVREKGPLFVIYPFDLDPALYNESVFNRSIWQVKSLEIV